MNRLTEAIYDAAVEPRAWPQVMQCLREVFATRLEGFYFLDAGRSAVRPVSVGGVPALYQRTFADRFLTPDNPCLRSEPLHRPGVVRTDERLVRYFRDPEILRRSQYYNDWMRPQEVEHTMGTTLLSEEGVAANISLLRPADVGAFSPREVATFASVCGHLRRAVRIAMRLETVTTHASTTQEALDCLAYGVVLLDLGGRLLYVNGHAEALLRRGDGLTVRAGRLVALDRGDQGRLDGLLGQVARTPDIGGSLGPGHTTIFRERSDRPLTVSAIRLSAQRRLFASARPVILLLIVDPATAPPSATDLLRQRYELTPAEARLALALLEGRRLRQAADAAGMTYETARWYLKIVFQKTETSRQSQLVARLLRDLAVPLERRATGPEKAGDGDPLRAHAGGASPWP